MKGFVWKTAYFLTKVHFIARAQRARPVIIDPGLYSLEKSDVFWVSEKRSVPSAYKLFTGKQFISFCFG